MHPSEENAGASVEMPRYVSHKKVWALEIADVGGVSEDGSATKLTFKDKGYAPIWAPQDMFSRYQPIIGDYYVQYADGYKSFSPRKAFLEGYTRERDFSKKPTIEELEKILQAPDTNPDGSVSAV